MNIINARVEEIFSLVVQEIKRSGYDGLLPAGMVLTGGCSALPGIRPVASGMVGLPVRIARPENLIGMVDRLDSPAFSTSVGLLRWALLFSDVTAQGPRRKNVILNKEVAQGLLARSTWRRSKTGYEDFCPEKRYDYQVFYQAVEDNHCRRIQ